MKGLASFMKRLCQALIRKESILGLVVALTTTEALGLTPFTPLFQRIFGGAPYASMSFEEGFRGLLASAGAGLLAGSLGIMMRLTSRMVGGAAQRAGVYRPRHVVRPPGTTWLTLCYWLFRRHDYENIYAPVGLDLRREYFEALKDHGIWAARWVHLKYCFIFAKTLGREHWEKVLVALWGVFWGAVSK